MASTLKVQLAELTFIYNVTCGVGLNMPNLKPDVELVQILLRMVGYYTTAAGMPYKSFRSLTISGQYDADTRDCLYAFEDYLKLRKMFFQSDNQISPSSPDGYTKSGVLYKIIHLNRFAREHNINDFNMLPFNDSTPAEVRKGILPGAPPPPKSQSWMF